ncbi:NADH:flavin oxidoreductase/NADH oxidase family protein [Streptomyces sp. NPDC051366]|uniref:NADH:flavin oxidoreductase/NADH oxidase family protein n=1 Tax=unclassified Streptomyces TaxID=2593676 RepID=UPI00224FEC33|nr:MULTISPECIES: NADH:flavin oxidoreductase/NADH oxidase family protein [unclassified Streptomyces]MCX4626609.1 NADH:flavin oxidoreductase/NADH oxidase family protein [Streptomyces sp. NBC_01443]WSW42777.1 NADH:flavin oxidoreductase/NADH oxidase family protein [Streptomyces sp. NBC_01001]
MTRATRFLGELLMDLFTPLELPNGTALPNRLAKAAMEESLAGSGQLPDERIERLYRRWAQGGAGLLITGNVMVDRRALTAPGTIVLDARSPLGPFRRWAEAASCGGGRVWMQINHPGRQVGSEMPGTAWAPSDIGVSLGRHTKRFARPTAMTEADIEATVARFAVTARRAEEAGFDGVQIHAAHGYLLSQFLSPLVNRRTDRWGGSLENRVRLLTEVVGAVRAQVGPGFAVGVKLNTADFQRGGFDTEEAAQVLAVLGGLGVDLVELSGGSVESPATLGRTADLRTLEREAYFLSFAEQFLGSATMPLMLTGGIGRQATAQKVLERGVSVVGLASALAFRPDLPARWRAGEDVRVTVERLHWKDRDLAGAGLLAFVRFQLHRLARGLEPRPEASPRATFALDQLQHWRRVRAYGAWLARNPEPEDALAG